jgi:hypothetical protein
MKFANRCLHRSFARLGFATWERNLPTMDATICALNEQHLTLVRMNIAATSAADAIARTACGRRDKQRGNNSATQCATNWWRMRNRYEVGQDARR